jgi:copper chaperone
MRSLKMTTYKVPNMTCGHCAGVVTETLKSLDPTAEIKVEVMKKEVTVTSKASADAVLTALANAGYPAKAA